MQDVISEIPKPKMAKLYSALAKAQSEYKPALKTKNNAFYGNAKYADLAEVTDSCREALGKYGLCVIQLVGGSPDEKGIPNVSVTTILAHESGESIESSITLSFPFNQTQDDDGGKRKSPNILHKIGAAVTYLRRVTFMSVAGTAAEDDDGNSFGHDDATKSQPKSLVHKGDIPPSSESDLDVFWNKSIEAVNKASNENDLKVIWRNFEAVKDKYTEQDYLKLKDLCAKRKAVLTKNVKGSE